MPEPLNVPTPISSRIPPDKPTYISVFGKKNSGKSVMARRFWDSWPRDACCIDVTADALKPEDVQETFRAEVPDRWPLPPEDANGDPLPRLIRYVPDAHSSLYHDNLDRSVGLAAKNPGSLLWIDEISIVSRVNRTGPYLNHLLIHGRHDRTSAVFCGPRSMGIDPLILAQSDYVYIFELPGVADRRRIAETCGIEPDLLDEAVHGLPKGGHDYLRWDGVELIAFPPLPLTRSRSQASPSARPVDGAR
jgi:hypothetical protein